MDYVDALRTLGGVIFGVKLLGCTLHQEIAALLNLFKPQPQRFSVLWARESFGSSPFALLTAIVLSQNTSDSNAIKAFESLRSRGLLTPEAVMTVDIDYLAELVKSAGQQKLRARTLKSLADAFLTQAELRDAHLLCVDCKAARKKLLTISGVGKKTADVFLSVFCGCKNVFPVDRHIARVTGRLVGADRLSYNAISSFWLECLRESEASEPYRLHMALIDIGRKVCRPKVPLCWKCVFKEKCLTAKRSS